MRLLRLTLAEYGRCHDVAIDIGEYVTVVLGVNEAGKSTARDALRDLLWGIPSRSDRAIDVPRNRLRIDAELEADGASRTVVRKGTGLFAADLVTKVDPPPWDRQRQLDAEWWRTRLGLDHAELREGGRRVFAGIGDIADIVFAAREGRSAREILAELTEQTGKLFKPDGRSRNAELRVAAEDYRQAVANRDALLTRAGEVVAQRGVVESCGTAHQGAKAAAAAAARALKTAEEDHRVIESVLQLRQARSELATIDREGDRLSAEQLTEYQRASAAQQEAEKRAVDLDGAIARTTDSIAALSVDDQLLDDKPTLDRLHGGLRARIEELHRADDEFGPAAAQAAALLRHQLRSIGVEVTGDLDDAVDAARVRVDHAAALDDLAGRIEQLEQEQQDAADERDRALGELSAKGVVADPATSTAPVEEAIGALRKALVAALNAEATAEKLFVEADDAVNELRSSAPGAQPDAVLTRAAVVEARGARDARWQTVRRSWVTGELPPPADRVDMAVELDRGIGGADGVADDEAEQRARIAAAEARTDAHVAGLAAARGKQQAAQQELADASKERRRLETEWNAMWAGLGVATGTDIDSGPVVAGLLAVAHAAHARGLAAAERIVDIDGAWRAAAELAGLPAATPPAAWRKRAEVLAAVEAAQSDRADARERETRARRSWGDFQDEAVELLGKHGAVDEGQPVTPAVIEQGLENLARRLDEAQTAAGKRTNYLEQVDEKRARCAEARQAQRDAAAALQTLAEARSVDPGWELGVLAQRAERADVPMSREATAQRDAARALNRGGDLSQVVDRLAGCDDVTVEQALEEARLADQEAAETAEAALRDYTSARHRLDDLEAAAGAADAEAAVMSCQADVARLAERWAILALQKQLLEDVLDDLGSDDTNPLLDHAGRILEQLTGGRWVALDAEDDGAERKLLVIRSDAERFGTSELSEGTADQVFLALRLAAVAELHRERTRAGDEALPLVLDDVLMAFDEVRAKNALRVLESLAPDLQVIVFTHHEHVAEAAGELDQVKVSRLPAAAPIADARDGDLIRAPAQ